MKATDETKQAAKAAGIKSWHVKSEEKLQDELALLNETATTNTGDEDEINDNDTGSDVCNDVSSPIESDEPKESEELRDENCGAVQGLGEEELILPTDTDKKTMKFSVKCVGEKSPYWKYRDML